mgnify:CR=1 FL=1
MYTVVNTASMHSHIIVVTGDLWLYDPWHIIVTDLGLEKCLIQKTKIAISFKLYQQ